MNIQSPLSNIRLNLTDVDDSLPHLLNHLETLQVAVLNNEDWPILNEQFQEVFRLAVQIFRREEEAMDICRDPGATSHKNAHQFFLKNLMDLRTRCETEGSNVALAQDLRSQTIRWINDHHRIMNAPLGRLIKDVVDRSVAYHESTGAIASTAA